MARYRGPVCKLCRREGLKLFLKGTRCIDKNKCSIEKRKNPPGLPPKRKGKISDFSIQLREKQKVKRIYGVLEKQFREYYEKANRTEGITGELLLQLLEQRLDNVIYRMKFATSRIQARSFISHGHVIVNGIRVTIPSYQVSVGDKISFRENFFKSTTFTDNIKLAQSLNSSPAWLSPDYANYTGEVTSIPSRENIDLPIKEHIIVELYSK
ncbi:MAG: 30S ribosomal protein S4 [Leptospiraceae bacterium]|nr:30S ribosomal protein S4 [Leptospiraceae bacterium]MCP5496665.1 30S ribosomal protein S4 [Leptospiraceae bacterium]